MLQRNSSKRLSHRKSTSSVQGRHDPIDPDVARQHAQVAATLAFARAKDRNSNDINDTDGMSRNNSTRQDQAQLSSQDMTRCEGEQGIRRQHSVRFAGPSAIPRRQSIASRATPTTVATKASSGTLRPRAVTTDAAVPAQYRPPSRSSSIGKASMNKATSDKLGAALSIYDEYYTREDDVASTPSSYRRLRKSKSMFSPVQAPSVFYTNRSPDGLYARGRQSLSVDQTPYDSPNPAQSRPGLRGPKSMSFLRGGTDHMMPAARHRNDAAVQIARDKFLHQVEQQRLREQPSFLFRSRKRREEKSFRKSVRSSSTGNGYGMPVVSATQDQSPRSTRLREKARKASITIKNKLRQVFGRSKPDAIIPNQQVTARETHVREYHGDPDITHSSFVDIPHPHEGSVLHVPSRVPSLHAASSSQQLRSRAGSLQSVRSERSGSDDKSRVTSWTTSTNVNTNVNTIASQGVRAQAEADRREQQRLSVINEHGTHVSSSAFGRKPLVNQFSAYPIVHRASKSSGHVAAQLPGPVDSARVYSALMKRLDENSPKAKLEAARKGSVESFVSAKHVPPRSSSAGTPRSKRRTQSTIRRVPMENSGGGGSFKHHHQWVRGEHVHAARAEKVFGNTGRHEHQWVEAGAVSDVRAENRDDVFSMNGSSNNENNNNFPPDRGRTGSNGSDMSREPSNRTSYHTARESSDQLHLNQQHILNERLSPQELAIRNESIFPSNGAMGIREFRSTFFGGSTFVGTRTTSPYRRALAERDYNTTHDPGIIAGDSPIHASYQLRNPLMFAGESANAAGANEKLRAYTESVYSRTTSGQTPAAASSSTLVLPTDETIPEMPFKPTGTGDVVIIDRSTYRPMPPSRSHDINSSTGSNEWRGWMSNQVAKLERNGTETNSSTMTMRASHPVNYALPSMPKSYTAGHGHVRENAQINNDDTDITQAEFSTIQQPLGLIRQNSFRNNPPNTTSHSTVEHHIHEIGQIQVEHKEQPPLNPPQTAGSSNTKQGLKSAQPSGQANAPQNVSIPVLKPILKNRSAVSLVEVKEISMIPIPPPPPLPRIPVRSPLRSMPSGGSLRSAESNTASVYTPGKNSTATGSVSGRNVLHKRNGSNTTLRSVTQAADTPASGTGKLVKKHVCSSQTTPSEEKIGNASCGSRTPYSTGGVGSKENLRLVPPGEKEVHYGSAGAGLMGPRQVQELDAQAMGSKRMVDLFLSSRRRRIDGGSDETSAFL